MRRVRPYDPSLFLSLHFERTFLRLQFKKKFTNFFLHSLCAKCIYDLRRQLQVRIAPVSNKIALTGKIIAAEITRVRLATIRCARPFEAFTLRPPRLIHHTRAWIPLKGHTMLGFPFKGIQALMWCTGLGLPYLLRNRQDNKTLSGDLRPSSTRPQTHPPTFV